MDTTRRTLEADRTQYLHDPISALLPFVPLSFDHATHPRCTRADKVIVVIDQVCFGAHDDDGHARCVVRERAQT